MPSESVAGFLDHAQASRVLFPEQVEQLIRQPDIPHSDLSALCEYLLARGVLTRFQATAIREGRGHELSYAGYPVLDEVGPCPGGMAYRALHPSLRTPLVLRRIRADWLAPTDVPLNFVSRARAFGMLPHPNLVHLLDAGVAGAEIYLVIDPPVDAADLETLAREIGGAMPAFLAAEYGRAVASALRLVHERGGVHGDVRPANLLVGPLATKSTPDGKTRRRPAPEAVVRLAELGLVPIRPPASLAPPDSASAAAYLAPERVDAGLYEPRGDIYGLGGTLYFLLTGRPPFAGESAAEVLGKVRSAEPTALAALRPDVPAEFTTLVGRMLDKNPDRRPPTAYDVETALIRFCRPGTVPPQPVPVGTPVSRVVTVAYPQPAEAQAGIPLAAPVSGVALAEPAPEPEEAWGVPSDVLASAHADAASTGPPRRREVSAKDKAKYRLLLILGAVLHLSAVAMLVLYFTGAFESSKGTDDHPKPTEKKDTQPQKKGGKGKDRT